MSEPKPPYWAAVVMIVGGLFTTTLVPTVFGVFIFIRCLEATKANRMGDHEEARRLCHLAWWNPLNLPHKVRSYLWIIVCVLMAIAFILIFLSS